MNALEEQNKILKGLLVTLVELLPRHSSDCRGLQVHPSNTEEYCSCPMKKVKKKTRELLDNLANVS